MNCRIIAIHLIILLLILPTLLPADNYRRYDVRTGLSGNCVRSILQDRTGYMWFATQDGLCRFNGSEFTQFGKDDNTDKPRNLNIIRILEHADGRRIWIATVEGLYIFDTDTERFEHFDKSTASGETIPSTFDMAYDHDGQLWIASGDGLFRYDEEHDRLTRYSRDRDKAARSLPGNHVWTIYVDRQGAVWVGTRGGLCRYNPHSDNFVTFRADNEAPFGRPLGNEILSITADATDNIWVGSWNDGIARLNPTNNRLHYYFGEGDSLFIPRVRTLYTPDNEGRLYAGSDDGFFVVNTSTLRCRQSTQRFADESIYHIAADREGGLWLGTYFGGAIYLSPKYKDIEWYYADAAPHGLSGNVVSQFCEEPSGKIWIATEDGGLNRFDPRTQRFEHFLTAPGNSEPCYRNLHALLWDGGRLWVGSFSHGLYLLNPATRATRCYRSDPQRPESTLPNDHIYSLLRSKGGTLFVGTMSGLARYDDRLDQFATIPSTRRIHVYDLAEDADGRIWIADKRDGVWSYNPRTDSLRHYPHNPQDPTTPAGNSVIRIAADSRGNLWFTAETGGICRYRPESDDFETLGVRQGLPNSVIYGMLDDGNGVFWLSSHEGLVRYEPPIQLPLEPARLRRHPLLRRRQRLQPPRPNAAAHRHHGARRLHLDADPL
jgi:ligand-binding sensor domain-containing protein